MLKILVAVLIISSIALYVFFNVTDANYVDRFFVSKSHNAVNFFREAGDRFWQFDWVQNRNFGEVERRSDRK